MGAHVQNTSARQRPPVVVALTTTTATTTTTSPKPKTDILVLSNDNKLNVPIIINGSGKEERNFFFVLGNGTEVYRSCSLTWQNRHFVFGGNNEKTQISMVDDCTLKLVGQLAFHHWSGGCANVDNRLIYLCFNSDNSDDYKKCRYSTSPLGEFEQISDSNHKHSYTRIAADKCKFHIIDHGYKTYLDEILAVGSWPGNVKTEVLNTNRNVWSVIQNYPYVSG